MEADEEPRLPSFETEDEAWAEVVRRNRLIELERGSPMHGYFKPDRCWIVVELSSGGWTVAEPTGPDRTKRQRFRGVLRDALDPFSGLWGP